MLDLLDARGYEITISCENEININIDYIGAAVPEMPDEKYDNDEYVVSHIKNITFTNEFKTVVKDTGISKSGLKIKMHISNLSEAHKNINVLIKVSDDFKKSYSFDENGNLEAIINTTYIRAAEKAYLKDVHEKLYLLLAEVDRVCRLHNIKYYLVFGSLLGAYRYGEIIPWDDDIDIAMTRRDFEKFRRVAYKDLGEDFKYLDASKLGKSVFLDFMCRVIYTKEKTPVNIFKKVSGKCDPEYENTLPLDIFVLDSASDNKTKHKIHMFMIRTIYGLAMGHRAYIDKEEYKERKFYIRFAVASLSFIGKLIPAKAIFKIHDRVSIKYRKSHTESYFISNGYLPFIHTKYDKVWFGRGKKISLGELEVMAPAEVEAYLKRAYYEYYHLPPVSSRYPQHSPECEGVR